MDALWIIWSFFVVFTAGFAVLKLSDLIYLSKWIISYIYVALERLKSKKRIALYDYEIKHDPIKANFLVPQEEYELESPQSSSHLLKKEDEVFFYGENSNSDILICRINRLTSEKAEATIYLKVSRNKSFHLEKTLEFQQSSTDEMVYSCGNLQLICNLPMRRWRLYYAGYLREVFEGDSQIGRMAYVKFSLLWRASSDVYDFRSDVSTICLADGISKASLTSLTPGTKELANVLDFYGQAGVIHGNLTIEDEFKDKEIYLFGHRIRYLGELSSLKTSNFYHLLGYTRKSGTYIHCCNINAQNLVSDLSSGFVVQSDVDLKGIEKASISIAESNTDVKGVVKSDFTTDIMSYKLSGFISSKAISIKSSHEEYYLKRVEFDLNGEIGYGILLKRSNLQRADMEYKEDKHIQIPKEIPPVVSFRDELCQVLSVTGGKGSSLGKLTQLADQLSTFTVSDGIVITTSAYMKFLTKNIEDEIKLLEEKSYREHPDQEEVSKICKKILEVITSTEFSPPLQNMIKENLHKYFGEKLHSQKFAVRSSGTGEDTDQMSAAGQMDTFLAVVGVDEILKAVKKCWASQFSFVAIEYKRRYGQLYNTPMAVVVQEMVSCEVAGVLFTCDPLTGNPTLMSISANYGLGESVVSGSEEPDTVQLKRDKNDNLKIKSIDIGSKKSKIIVKDTGTSIETVSENEQNVCSLPDELLLRLGYIAIEVEKHYHSSRDLEWGVVANQFYLFQSRPVTSSTKETTYEIDHEFDSPLRVENDFYSISNVGEVMPKGLSPLSLDFSTKNVKLIMNSDNKETLFQMRGKAHYFHKGWVTMCNHFMFNVADLFPLKRNEEVSGANKANFIALFGRVPDIAEMYEVSRSRYGILPPPNPLKAMYTLLKAMFVTGKRVEESAKFHATYTVQMEDCKTAKDVFSAVLHDCTDNAAVSICHVITTQTSSVLNLIVLMILGAGRGNFDEVVYTDFGKLLKSGSGVESADVPTAIQNIASLIEKEIKPEDFKRMSVKEALHWLQTTPSEAGKKFNQFMEKHGHRCLQEFDMYSVRWGENPENLVKTLQSLVGTVSKNTLAKKSEDTDDPLSDLTVPLGLIAKKFIKLILPFCRRAVQYREESKSLFIKGYGEWRKGLKKVGKLMVLEGRIPEEDLIFFMTLNEIDDLLKTRSPKIISKATQRQKRFKIISEYRFPEIMKGVPKPMDDSNEDIVVHETGFSMKGIPVSQGIAKGFIRKALSLEEAVHIKPGEILLTYCTDIGWTPYFPHLAGVVTELGGLISHGAVVSREYGIPCIAGLHGAIKHFHTGDYVMLDGNKGLLQRLEPPKI